MLTDILPMPSLLVSGILLLSFFQLLVVIATCAALRSSSRLRAQQVKIIAQLVESKEQRGAPLTSSSPSDATAAAFTALRVQLPERVAKELSNVVAAIKNAPRENKLQEEFFVAAEIRHLERTLADAVEGVISQTLAETQRKLA